MKIKFNNEIKKHYVEILPSISFSWYGQRYIHIQWLVFSIGIDL